MNYLLQTLAMAAPAGAEGQSSMMSAFMPLILVFAIFYFMLIRPQQRKEKERKQMIANIKSGDRVMFSGIIGTVTNIKDDVFTVKIAEKVKVEVMRGAVTRMLEKGEKVGEEQK
ncbi:preprotein translocase subunit YajC [Verrucomicrobiota bacterium]